MDEREELERRVGTMLRGKWKLERLLGVGGMAAVYVGRHEIGRREAIKILHPAFAKDRDLRKRFEREAQAANKFRHPGAVEIHDIDVAEDGSPFLVMELLEGESLATRAEKGAVPMPDLLRFADELLDVLAAAHAEGIVHRDIKPDNLFVMSDGRLKVLDFGIARMRQGSASSLYTKAGAMLGTLSYMPPEQILGEEVDARADLFAVGATMFRLVARRRIHEANSETDMVVKMATLAAPKLVTVAPHAGREVGLVVDRALAFSRMDRYPEASTMQADVRAVRAGQEPPHAARLASLGLDPAQGAPSPTRSASQAALLAEATRIAAPPTHDEAMGPPSVIASRAVAPASTRVVAPEPAPPSAGAWAPRPAAPSAPRPPWVYALGIGAVLIVIGGVLGFSCSSGEGHPEARPQEGAPPPPPQDEPRGMHKQQPGPQHHRHPH
ncbi:MAG TPA: protein kinase [Byssovorax sp.]|jgi:serine/threonine-protein kinase